MVIAPLAPSLLTLVGVLHLGALAVLSLPGSTRALTTGDIAFFTGVGALYLISAAAISLRRRWGRWLGLVVAGVEAIPGIVLLYVQVVFAAEANRLSLEHFGILLLLLAPLVVFIGVWLHRL